MKKWIFSLALGLTFQTAFASQEMTDHGHLIPVESFKTLDREYVSPETIDTGSLVVIPSQIEGFSGESLTKLRDAFQALEIAVNSAEFKDRIINFKNSNGERRFDSNRGLSNEQIYQMFMDGREVLLPNTPGEMNFFLKLYNRPWSRVIGYTNPDTNLININWKYFKTYRPSDVAANLAHEWTHKIGFDHKSAKERNSVPYAIGYIVGDLAEKYLKLKSK
jgi:hypothetical protein